MRSTSAIWISEVAMHVVSRSLFTMFLGLAALSVPLACGDDAEGDGASTSSDDDDAADDDAADDDAADDDDDGPAQDDDDSSGTDDDNATDDDAEGPTGPSTFETDAGTFEVEFSGVGETCGGETCANGTLYENGESRFMFDGCCVDEDGELCGVDFSILGNFFGLSNPGCEALDLPGSDDPSCEASPPLDQILYDPLKGVVLEGCCQESGECGYSASFDGFGFGCVSPTRFGYDEGADCEYQP
jgi:hypothetical protein